IMGVSNNPKKNYGIRQKDIDFIKRLNEKYNVVTVLFGNSYAARFIDDLPHVLVAYEENDFTEKLVPQIIFGGRSAHGKLPVTVSAKLPAGTGWHLEGMNRLGYSSPESHDMDSYTLEGIDYLMEKAIAKRYTPGGVVLVAKDGNVVFEKAYG